MTLAFLQLDETGVYVTGAGYAPALGENMVAAPEGRDPSEFLRHYYLDGFLVPRPQPPLPVRIPGGWQVGGCPLGTGIAVYDVTGGEILDYFTASSGGQDYEFALPDAGTYRLEIDAPDPFTDVKLTIEVP
ncbi:hypothetical protein ETW23_03925 [Leisingera sp. NJS201]|uniref:hypothetical protein n=1 Tax=Leisingera sp. NJS201 TaxID=2508306 RepID=UPI001070BA96|nr:hypothetical protein [Leisingera sp. NJS201]QBR35414.1 hypothetical protein ETW23_03925 [Leisingera sp. NJS201]